MGRINYSYFFYIFPLWVIEWGINNINRSTIKYLLHNPTYAGAYVYGQKFTDSRKKKPGRPSSGRRNIKVEEWDVLLKDRLPSYITWEQYECNLRQLAKNATQNTGVIRQGSSLLSRLIICGKCGSRMVAHYENKAKFRYTCCLRMAHYAEPLCQSLVGEQLEQVIIELIHKALQPTALEISLQAAEEIKAERLKLNIHWQQRLERARYEVERSFRQYNSVEPENRLVARSLEQQWEALLAAEEILRKNYNSFLLEQPPTLSEKDRETIRQLATDVPALWQAPTTSVQDKKAIIRYLIEQIIVTVQEKTEKVVVQIQWFGGHQTTAEFNRLVGKLKQLSNYNELLDRMLELNMQNKKPKEIAKILNTEGWRPARRRDTFNSSMVLGILYRLNKARSYKRPKTIPDKALDEWTLCELAKKLEMPQVTLYALLRQGKLSARIVNIKKQKIWLIKADENELIRIKLINKVHAPRKWARFIKVD